MAERPCRTCGAPCEVRPGRGRQSPYCDGCRKQRERALAGIRMLRHTNTTVNEWIEALGPTILSWKEDLTRKQNGKCLRCGKRQRLYFAIDPGDQLVGLCNACHAGWTYARRISHHGTRP